MLSPQELKKEESLPSVPELTDEQINWKLMKIWVGMCEDWNMRLALMNHSLRMENLRLKNRIEELEGRK